MKYKIIPHNFEISSFNSYTHLFHSTPFILLLLEDHANSAAMQALNICQNLLISIEINWGKLHILYLSISPMWNICTMKCNPARMYFYRKIIMYYAVYSLFWAEILENRSGSSSFPGKHITALHYNLDMASTNYACALFRSSKNILN